MNISDFFNTSIMENIGSVPLVDMVLTMALAFGTGWFINMVYRKTCTGVMVSAGFGGTLVALCMITAMTILAVTSNVVLSLGMVGALSIVRFRTAIKEPVDIAFLFWAIAAGIVLAAGMVPVAVLGSAAIGVVMLMMINRKAACHPYLAVISCAGCEAEALADEYLKKHVERMTVKSKTAQEGRIELHYEVCLKDGNTDFVTTLSQLDGVHSAVLVSYNGDFAG